MCIRDSYNTEDLRKELLSENYTFDAYSDTEAVSYTHLDVYKRQGLFLPPTEKEIYKALDRCNNARGIILTYPNYFGIGYDIFDTLKDLKERGLTIIIDGAHGAHYGISRCV